MSAFFRKHQDLSVTFWGTIAPAHLRGKIQCAILGLFSSMIHSAYRKGALDFHLATPASVDAVESYIVREGIILKRRPAHKRSIGSTLFFDPRASQALINPRNAGERKYRLIWVVLNLACPRNDRLPTQYLNK